MTPSVVAGPSSPRRPFFLIGLALLALLGPASVRAQDVPFTVAVSGYVQPRYTHVDPDDAGSTGSFGVRRARVTVRGDAYEDFAYYVQVDFAGSSTKLMDGWIARRFSPLFTLAAGQAKAPFGRQQLTSDSGLQFVDRGILDPRFNPARQPGVWVSGGVAEAQLAYSAGIFNGEGINLANDDKDFMRVARVVWTPLGAYAPEESSQDFPERPRLALGLAVISTTVGTTSPYDALRVGGEAAFKVGGFSAVAEFVQERLTAGPDQLDTSAWYGQAGYLLRSGFEVAVRYSTIDPDAPGASNADQKERGVAISRYFEGHDMKIQADLLEIESEALDTSAAQVRVQLQLAL
jgi:phosphate-selective porin